MEYMLEPPTQFIGSALLALVAGWMGIRGLHRYFTAVALPATNVSKSLALMHSFRHAIIGVSFAALALAWATEMLWLAIISLVVLGEETLETTMAIAAMSYGKPRNPSAHQPPAS
jgi:hypothetical protein